MRKELTEEDLKEHLLVYNNIKRMAHERGMSVTELQLKAGLSRSLLSDYKAGKSKSIGKTSVSLLCATLECTPEQLLNTDENTSPIPPAPKQHRNENFYERALEEMRNRKSVRNLMRAAVRANDKQVQATATLLESIIDGTLGSTSNDMEGGDETEE